MRRLLVVLALAATGQAVPTWASTSAGSVVDQVALTATTAVRSLTQERLVALTWTAGSPRVRYRWHQPEGWSPWAVAEDDTAASPVGRPGTAPLWRPRLADQVEVAVQGRADGVRLVTVSDTKRRRALAAHAATGRQLLGAVHSRADWGADESLRSGRPSYAARVDAVVVHHTADANGYQPSDVPALIRADYLYHVQTRGWLDLGYNLLVDQFGGVWEGRAGGLGRATVGAHAEGFNTGTLGVALIGDLTKAAATEPAERALAHVIAYAAATWRFDPTGSVALLSKGSPRFAAGRQVRLSRVFGHGQTGDTACPGALQDRLPVLRSLAKLGLGPAPAITAVQTSGAPVHAPKPFVLDARLSLPASWTVQVLGSDGKAAGSSSGRGLAPHLSWNGFTGLLPALPGSYTWVVTADDGFHDPVRRTGPMTVGLPLLGP
jgi:hypothetical protein